MRRKKILVLGASGMAGHVIALSLLECGRFDVLTLAGTQKVFKDTTLIDVSNKVVLDSYLEQNYFDVIINCIGILVSRSETHKDLATYINSYLPHYLEARYATSSTKVIHLSTDCVFSGDNAPYDETDFPDGKSFYDRSKTLGEILNEKDLTFRMSIVGPELQEDGIGLFNWFSQQSGTIKGYTGSVWNGITTIELAKAVIAAIDQNITGLYHLTSKKSISKFQLLCLFNEEFPKNDLVIEPVVGVVHDKTLRNNREDFDFTVSSYRSMIHEMKNWVENHPSLYRHYDG